jgi:hypothetical protein
VFEKGITAMEMGNGIGWWICFFGGIWKKWVFFVFLGRGKVFGWEGRRGMCVVG